jgi:outer membrane biosynthesis protein TonB
MKGSLATSAIVHVSALAFALVSLGAPEPLEVGSMEALPVDLVPIEELTQIQQGDKKAPLAEQAAPVPTSKPNIVENAENVGDNDLDLKSPPTPTQKPVETEVAAAPEKTETPLPNPTPEKNEVKEIVPEETAPKPTETAALPEPKPEVTPEPKPEPAPEPTPEPAEAESEEIPLPDSVPLPSARPKPEPPKEQAKPAEKPPEKKTETAKASEKPSDKKVADKKQETAKSTSSKESDFNADEIAALLNKQDAAGGGAKRSSQQAALGGKKTTGGSKLSQSELDALRGQIQNNWSVIAGIEGADGVIITVTMQLDESGAIVGRPEVKASGGSDSARRTLEGSALRAVMRSSPFKNLPPDKYDAWSEVVVNFDPSELL